MSQLPWATSVSPMLKVTNHLSYLNLSSFLLLQQASPKPPPDPQTRQKEQSWPWSLAASNNILLFLPCKGCPGELSNSSPPQINFWWHKSFFHSELWLGNPDVQLAAARRREKRIWEKEIPVTTIGPEELWGRNIHGSWTKAGAWQRAT